MSEGSNADGGYTVPEDIVTRIEKYRDAKASLRQYVRVIPVQTMSGARTFKKRATVTGFAKVLENGKFAKKNTPQFERLAYKIDKFGGYFVLPDEVLEDSDVNLVNEVVELIGDESRVTDNVEIISAIKAAKTAPVNLEDLNGIKEALNVTLGQAFRATSAIYTNDNGLQFLDTLVDANERPLLAPSPVDPMKMVLGVGPTTVPIVVLPNADFPNLEQGIPFIIGDLDEGVALFDRRRVTLMQSKTASVDGYNAFEQGGLLIRADERADYVVRDAAAFVLGYIAI
jgi:HK97 family phage major capsid protein